MSKQLMTDSKAKGIGLLSGGLDSILAVKVLQDQDLDLLGVTFTTPFFPAQPGIDAGRTAGIDVQVIDLTEKHLAMLRNPVYGFGSQMNPCIDCHALMLREAGHLMEQIQADFLFTGEVLGQRPMSQRRDSLRSVEKLSGYPGRILRPLSARLLPSTLVESQGRVDRERLLNINGRSRKKQIELSRHYGIKDYPQPGGGCMLTKEGFARKLRELFGLHPQAGTNEIELLKWGRHFRLPGGKFLAVGRQRADNEKLESLANREKLILRVLDYPGPIGVLLYSAQADEELSLPAKVLISYSDAPLDGTVRVEWKHAEKTGILTEANDLHKEDFKQYLL
jgi:hypothetical protein